MSIMEADEYMNPKIGNSMPGPSRLGSSSTTGADMLGPMHSRHNWDRELRKFGDIHRLGNNDYLLYIILLHSKILNLNITVSYALW